MASLSLAEPGRPLVYQDTCLRISRIPRYSPLYRICRRAWRSIISRISSAPGRGRSFPVRSYSKRSEKIRKGFDDQHVNAVEIARIAEDAGASAVAVHGRTREQYYSGKADWDIIRQVKEAVSIPVIGNGDVVSGASALAMMEETGCDGVMIGRGAQGNP